MEDTLTSSPEECYNKLEKLKEIRQKTIQIEKMKISIKESFHGAEEESKVLEEYKKEIALLLQEKMAHVEELRLIHTDINTMENLVKQSSIDRNDMLNDGQNQVEQYKPLKRDLDKLRQEIGLEKCSDLFEEEPGLAAEMLCGREVYVPDNSTLPDSSLFVHETTPDKLQLVIPDSKQTSHPPPMKVCLSCHQQIHRNAPICPLCKAKSRSRNPKKPKKSTKTEQQ